MDKRRKGEKGRRKGKLENRTTGEHQKRRT